MFPLVLLDIMLLRNLLLWPLMVKLVNQHLLHQKKLSKVSICAFYTNRKNIHLTFIILFGWINQPFPLAALPPSLNFLTVTGEFSEGEMLTASYGYIGGHEGKSLYSWCLHEVCI